MGKKTSESNIECTHCHVSRPREWYSPSHLRKYQYQCRDCHNEWAKARHKRPKYLAYSKAYQKKYFKENTETHRWWRLCRKARERGFGILSKNEFLSWRKSKSICEYCGIGQETAKLLFKRVMEIDRKDNSIGYTLDNICLACHRCNIIKNEFLTHDQMMKVAEMFIKPYITISKGMVS